MTSFAIAFDYLCPFARNANEHVVAGLRAGADWAVSFLPYSLVQGKVQHGEPAVWEREDPTSASGILALLAGLTVRDHHPERFLDAHLALFAARHDEGNDINDEAVVRAALAGAGVDADEVLETVRAGEALETLRKEHQHAVDEYHVWGVPTFVAGDRGVFVRLLDRPEGDADRAVGTIERVVDLVAGWPALHEFKQTDLPV